MSGFLAAVGFLTRIPVSQPGPSLDSAPPWFPVVGSLVGALTGVVYAGAYQILPSPLAALAAVVAGILTTGAFHEDGLADTADAFGSGAEGDRAIEIMKDSRLGTYGTLAIVVTILWRTLAVGSLDPWIGLIALVVAHTLARASSVALMATASPARRDGLGVLGVTRSGATAAGLYAVVAAVFATGPMGLVGLVAVIGVVAWFRRASKSKIGGISGDVLGATEQVAEIVMLTVIAAFVWTGSSVWWL